MNRIQLGSFLHHGMSSWEWKDQLFTVFDERTKEEVFLNNEECNRWVTTDEDHIKFICQWNNLESTVIQWLNNRSNFPVSGQPWNTTFSCFKTDRNMAHPQAFHLDVGPRPWSLSSNKQFFPFSIMIGIEDYTFLDVVDCDEESTRRICIQKGDVLAFRGDIPHGGTENKIDHAHYRIHAYIDSGKLRDDEVSNNEETVPYMDYQHTPMSYDIDSRKWRFTETHHIVGVE